jgi:hypothetical protein
MLIELYKLEYINNSFHPSPKSSPLKRERTFPLPASGEGGRGWGEVTNYTLHDLIIRKSSFHFLGRHQPFSVPSHDKAIVPPQREGGREVNDEKFMY